MKRCSIFLIFAIILTMFLSMPQNIVRAEEDDDAIIFREIKDPINIILKCEKEYNFSLENWGFSNQSDTDFSSYLDISKDGNVNVFDLHRAINQVLSGRSKLSLIDIMKMKRFILGDFSKPLSYEEVLLSSNNFDESVELIEKCSFMLCCDIQIDENGVVIRTLKNGEIIGLKLPKSCFEKMSVMEKFWKFEVDDKTVYFMTEGGCLYWSLEEPILSSEIGSKVEYFNFTTLPITDENDEKLKVFNGKRVYLDYVDTFILTTSVDTFFNERLIFDEYRICGNYDLFNEKYEIVTEFWVIGANLNGIIFKDEGVYTVAVF